MIAEISSKIHETSIVLQKYTFKQPSKTVHMSLLKKKET